MKRICLALLALLVLPSLAWGQPPTGGRNRTKPPLVISSTALLPTLRVTDGDAVMVATPTSGSILVYDEDYDGAVDNDSVFLGPGGVGRFRVIDTFSGSPLQANLTKVQSFSDLNSIAPSHGELIQLLGYTNPGDASGGLYWFDSDSEETVDNSFVLNGPGGTGRYLAVAVPFIGGRVVTASDMDTTPSVLAAATLIMANTGTVNITDFDDGLEGQRLIVIADSNTRFVHGASTIQLQGATDYLPDEGGTISFVRQNSIWKETARSEKAWGLATINDADTTPSVLGQDLLSTSNTTPTTITNFDNAVEGQAITVVLDANTTIADNANIELAGGANFPTPGGGLITLVYNGSKWQEVCRSDFTTVLATAIDSDTTPSVKGIERLAMANASPTTITQLDDGIEGQTVTLLLDSNTTVTHGTYIRLGGAANFTPSSSNGGTLTLTKEGSLWKETGRADFATTGAIPYDITRVDTLADLASAAPGDGYLVVVAGHTAIGDGGGSLYYYDADSAATANGGTVVDGPSSVGRYLLISSPYLPGRTLTASDGDTTPTVAGAATLVTANTGSTTIANFDNPLDGQRLTVVLDANTTIDDGANISLHDNTDWNPTAGGSLQLIYQNSTWKEIGRADYAAPVLSQVLKVDTRSSLASVAPTDEQLVIVSGYSAVGDGGGGIYRYDADSSATVDNAHVVDGPSSVGRYLLVHGSPTSGKQATSSSDVTPSVAGVSMLTFANSGAVTVTSFDDATDGQVLYVIFEGNTTLDHNNAGAQHPNIYLHGGIDFKPQSGGALELIYDAGLDTWREVGRSAQNPAAVNFENGDTTPSVANGTTFATANSGATTVTNFDNGTNGQIITVVLDSFTTLDHSSSLVLEGAVDWTPDEGGVITLVRHSNAWKEVSRSEFSDGPKGLVRPGDRVIVGSTVAATDDAAIALAVSDLNTQGYGTLWLVGEVSITTQHDFTAPISVKGLSADATLNVATNVAALKWGSSWNPVATAVAFTAASAEDTIITSANLALDVGDWITVQSDDRITGSPPHNYNTPESYNYPMEVHQIREDLGTNQYHLGSFLIDDYQTNPKIAQIPILSQPNAANRSNVEIADFDITCDSGIVQDVLFDVRRLNGVTVRDVNWVVSSDGVSPSGYFFFSFCSSVEVASCDCDIHAKETYGYVFVAGTLNGMNVHDCNFRATDSNHFFTTGSSYANGNNRYGTPRGINIHDNYVHVAGNYSPEVSSVAIDFHAEGWGNVVQNNLFHMQTESGRAQLAMQTRARNTSFIGNTVYAAGPVYGIRVYAQKAHVMNNRFYDCWRGVYMGRIAEGYEFGGHVVIGNTFDGGTGTDARITCRSGDDIKIIRNSSINSPSVIVAVEMGDDIDVMHNDFHDVGSSDTEATISFNGTDSTKTFTVDAGTDVCTASSTPVITNGARVYVSSSGTLPDPLQADTVYYYHSIDSTTFYLTTVREDVGDTDNSQGSRVDFTDTGSGVHSVKTLYAADDCNVVHNVIHNAPKIAVEFLGGGDNNHVVGNVLHGCASSLSLIKFVDGTGHRVSLNEVPKDINTYFLSTGNCTSSDITVIGNVADGYGSGKLGIDITGAAAGDFETDWADDNWVDD